MEELPHPFSARPVVTEQHRAVLVRREGPWGLQGSWQRGQLLAEHCSRSHFWGKHSATCVQQTITSHFPCPGVRCTDMEQSEAGSAPNIGVLRGSPEKKHPLGAQEHVSCCPVLVQAVSQSACSRQEDGGVGDSGLSCGSATVTFLQPCVTHIVHEPPCASRRAALKIKPWRCCCARLLLGCLGLFYNIFKAS